MRKRIPADQARIRENGAAFRRPGHDAEGAGNAVASVQPKPSCFVEAAPAGPATDLQLCHVQSKQGEQYLDGFDGAAAGRCAEVAGAWLVRSSQRRLPPDRQLLLGFPLLLYYYSQSSNMGSSAPGSERTATKQCIDRANGFQQVAGAACRAGQVKVNFWRINVGPDQTGITWHLVGGK